MLRGIDLSSHQPVIDWGQVAMNYAFAIVKCSGGADYANPNYHEQIAGARAAGLVVGHYHFAHEDENPGPGPGAEAAYFLAHADVQPGELVALDIEDTGVAGNLSDWALRWLQTVESAIGCKPLIYSFKDYIETRGLGTAALAAYPLWFARYWSPYVMQPWPQTPELWPKIAIWQWSGGTNVPGIANDTDDNLFDGDRAALVALGKPGLAPPPATGPARVVTPATDWEGAGTIVSYEQILVARNEETGQVSQRRQVDFTMQPWISLSKPS